MPWDGAAPWKRIIRSSDNILEEPLLWDISCPGLCGMEALSHRGCLMQNGNFRAIPNQHFFCCKKIPGCFFSQAAFYPRFLLAQGKVVPAGSAVCLHPPESCRTWNSPSASQSWLWAALGAPEQRGLLILPALGFRGPWDQGSLEVPHGSRRVFPSWEAEAL